MRIELSLGSGLEPTDSIRAKARLPALALLPHPSLGLCLFFPSSERCPSHTSGVKLPGVDTTPG